MASETKFTGGIWEPSALHKQGLYDNSGAAAVIARIDRGENDKRVALVDLQTKAKRGEAYKTSCAERDANLALICAAPDLLAALKAMVLNDAHSYRDCHKAALAAIAKAEAR